jgi:hypothetical protein
LIDDGRNRIAAEGLRSPVKHRLFDDAAVSQVLDHDPFEQRRGDPGVPDRIRIHDDDGTAGANSQAWRLPSLHSTGPEQQPFTLKQVRQQGIQLPAASIRRAEPAGADEDMT